jgi:hypothetical protein
MMKLKFKDFYNGPIYISSWIEDYINMHLENPDKIIKKSLV